VFTNFEPPNLDVANTEPRLQPRRQMFYISYFIVRLKRRLQLKVELG